MDASLRIPHSVDNDPRQREAHEVAFKCAKDAYQITVEEKKESWQAARFILPMGTCHRWMININYLALQGMCAQRLKFCEQFDLVGATWLMREEIEEKFPLLAAFLRPGCDFAGKCQYHSNYALSDLFGALFRGCGRHKVEEGHQAEFNCACSTSKEIEDDLRMRIPKPDEWRTIIKDAVATDRTLCMVRLTDRDIDAIMEKMGL
jgi:thymidylate synthase ThyX